MRVTVTDSQIRSWRLRGFRLEQIARACGSSISKISHRIQQIWQTDQAKEEGQSFPYWGDPDEQTIRERCLQIQSGWSDRERKKREVGRARSWNPAAVRVSIRGLDDC
jgi:hypothetical protein